MDSDELAFAGIARQAELVRAGEVSSRELVELYLERIERLDPQLNAFRIVWPSARWPRPTRPTRAGGAASGAAARRADRDQGQRRRRRRGHARTAPRAFEPPAGEDAEHRRAAARRGRGDHRQDQPARAGDLRLHRVGDLGRHPQPLGPRAHARRLERRQRRGGRRRPGRRGASPPTAAARSGSRPPTAASSGSSRSAGASRSMPDAEHWHGLSVNGCRHAHASPTPRSSSTWPPGRPRRRRTRRRRRRGHSPRPPRTPPGQAADRGLDQAAAPVAAAARRPTRSERGARGDRGAAALARPRGRASATPTTGASATTFIAALPRRHPRGRRGRSRTPSGWRAARAASRGSARLLRPRRCARARAREAAEARSAIGAIFERPRRPDHPDDRRAAGRGRPLGGHGRAADAARDEPRLPVHIVWNYLGQPAASVPPGSPTTACRCRSSSSAARTTRRRCSRSPPRSRPSGRGRTSRPPSPERAPRLSPMAVEPGSRRRAHEWLEEVYGRQPERDARFETISGEPVEPLYTQEDLRGLRPRARPRLPRRVPLHARRLSVDVPRAAVDDAPVRRLRHGRGDQRALPLPARPRPDRALDRLRHADADGPRLRPRALPRRGRGGGRRGRHARRHEDALRRHPARRGHRPR